MRVVAGQAKGLPLKAVPGKTTRPTTDKVKESIFNMIGPFFDGGTAVDLFAGSGGLGIEALSRGIEHAVFTDKDKKAIDTIQANKLTASLSFGYNVNTTKNRGLYIYGEENKNRACSSCSRCCSMGRL